MLRRAQSEWKKEMKKAEIVIPATAIIATLASLTCCLPLALLAALGSLAVALAYAKPWLLGLSGLLLAVALVQLFRRKGCGLRSTRAGIFLVWAALLLILAVALYPQGVASILASLAPDRGAN
jgi:hypothetical protein